MSESVLIAPSAEPISLLEAKVHLRVTDTAQDSVISRYLAAARQQAENLTQRRLMHTRYVYTCDKFPMLGYGTPLPFDMPAQIPPYGLRLLQSPLVRVVTIQYLDMSGTLQTMPATDYVANTTNLPGFVAPVFGKIWPVTLPQVGAVTVTYDAGHASPIAANATTDQITVTGPVTWAVNDLVRFSNSGGALPAPLQPLTDYYVKTAPGNGIYTLAATSGGATIDLTDTGTGQSYIGVVPDGILSWLLIRVGSLHENREEVAILNRGKVEPLPFVDGLLDPYRVVWP